jgi:putative transposase
MREFLALLVHLVVVVVRLAKPGGVRSVVAESVLVRQQLLILNRGRKRAPNIGVSVEFKRLLRLYSGHVTSH